MCVIYMFIYLSTVSFLKLAQNRWHNLPTVSDPGLLELSPSALGFLVHIQHLLHSLKTSVAPLVQDKLFHRLISKLDALLLDQVSMFQNSYYKLLFSSAVVIY